jgi:uncharacterized membrane protein YkvA (DUF1232 family)
MTTWIVAVLASLAAAYLGLLTLLWWARSAGLSLGEGIRFGPELVGLVRRIAGDEDLPRSVRVRLWMLLAYLLCPVDLVPDFLPVIGYADDLIVVALALRSVLKAAGPEAVTRHWRGSPAGLSAVLRLSGLDAAEREREARTDGS